MRCRCDHHAWNVIVRSGVRDVVAQLEMRLQPDGGDRERSVPVAGVSPILAEMWPGRAPWPDDGMLCEYGRTHRRHFRQPAPRSAQALSRLLSVDSMWTDVVE
jgi:hypothetical protein